MPRRTSTALFLAVAALVVSSACSSSSPKKAAGDQHRTPPAIGTVWASAHMKSLGGIHGRFRSEVLGRACGQPPVEPCVVGGYGVIDSGQFTLHSDSASYLHVAFGNGADTTELAGYRVRQLENGDSYIQQVGRASGCWKQLSSALDFGYDFGSGSPSGFWVVNDAEPDHDPAVGKAPHELIGHAPARAVLQFLGFEDLDPYDEFNDADGNVPVHLRMDSAGNATGFWVDGEEVAVALVGPDPDSKANADPAAFVPAADSSKAKAVREALSPLHGDFRMYDFDVSPRVRAPRRC